MNQIRLLGLILTVFLFARGSAFCQTKPPEKLTLAQSIDHVAKMADDAGNELLKQEKTLLKTHAIAGPVHPRSVEQRNAFLLVVKRKAETEVDLCRLLALKENTNPDADTTRPLDQWLKDARQPLAVLQAVSAPLPTVNYDEVDRRTRAVPKEAAESIEMLAAALVKGCRNDREKARAIFTWIAENIVYDTDGLSDPTRVEIRPNQIIKVKLTLCLGYARLYEVLARAAGLEVVVITGASRSSSVAPEFVLLAKPTERGMAYIPHAWNAVKLDGQWYLLDATDAGTQKKSGGKTVAVEHILPDLFLMQPDRAILKYWPDEDKWQLLKTPINKHIHERLPIVYPVYFQCGLKLESHVAYDVPARKELVLLLQVPRDVMLVGKLHRQDGKEVEDAGILVQRQGTRAEVRVSFPRVGVYSFYLFAGRAQPGKTTNLDGAIDFKVSADPGLAEAPKYPVTTSAFAMREGQMIYPTRQKLKAGQSNLFLVALPGAAAATLETGGQKLKLIPVGNDLFLGDIRPGAGEIVLTASYLQQPNLLYQLIKFMAE